MILTVPSHVAYLSSTLIPPLGSTPHVLTFDLLSVLYILSSSTPRGGLCLLDGVQRVGKRGSGTDILVRVLKHHNPPLCPAVHHVAPVSTREMVDEGTFVVLRACIVSIHYSTTGGKTSTLHQPVELGDTTAWPRIP
jgi:hypothetical protein